MHPFVDFDAVPDYLNSRIDPMDDDGNIPLPTRSGLGEDINFDYIADNVISTH